MKAKKRILASQSLISIVLLTEISAAFLHYQFISNVYADKMAVAWLKPDGMLTAAVSNLLSDAVPADMAVIR
jgi:hypothetical protein